MKQTVGAPKVNAAQDASFAPTIRRQLIILTATLVVPAGLTAILLLAYTYVKERAATAYQLQTTARALSIAVDRQLGEAGAMAQALSTAPSLLEDNLEAFDRQARLADTIDDSWVVVRAADGRQLVNTRLPFGAPLPGRTATVIDQRQTVVDKPYISNLASDARLGPRVAVAVPVLQDGKLRYEVDVALRAASFNQIFLEQRLSPRSTGIIIDRNGIVVSHSRSPEETVGRPVTPEFQERLRKQATDGLFEGASLEGQPTFMAYSRSPRSGWTFAVAIPRVAVGAAARRSLYIAAAIGVFLIGLGGFAGRRIASGITRPVEGLVECAVALGKGNPVSRAATGLAETDLVADALYEAAEKIRSFTTSLEQKVEERTQDLADANRQLSDEIMERKRAEQQLARIQRLEAVGQLSGGIAHDFNNLLQAIVGNVDLAKLRSSDPKAKLYLDHALSAAERGAKLTGQLLAFARKQRLSPVPVAVTEIVDGIVEILRSTLDKTIEIRTDLPEFLWPAFSDPTQLELIIVNLAINARDAMPAGGKILISAANIVRQEPARPEEPPAGEFVELVVSDTGAGIPPSVLGKVFEPFFTTKGIGKGTGLGLSQVLGLAQQLGGGVVIESEPGRGTAVKVYLKRVA